MKAEATEADHKKRWSALRVLPLVLAVLSFASPAQISFTGSYPLLDGDVIRYQTTPPNDPIARLQRLLDQGAVKLSYQESHGYLASVLEQLKIPASSQMLVFSKTSSQQPLISPATPRALYFNESVYVGWVRGGVLELAAVDPCQGTMFYTLDQHRDEHPKFVRREECLQCHATPDTAGVPGLLMRSVYTAADGVPQLLAGVRVTTHGSPIRERWGGWYVTGTHGNQRHMGNTWFKDKDHPDQLEVESGANVTSLRSFFDVTQYLTPHSDLVALMILAHQTRMHDLITRVNWETRLALNQPSSTSSVPVEELPDPVRRRIYNAVEILLRYMLFTDETRLEGPVQGTSTFAREFEAAGLRDTAGRSLRDLDLKRRMFRYPCSYMIYSQAFDSLPKPALDYFYRRLWDILTESDEGSDFANLTTADRRAILSILRQTKTGLPSYWHAAER